MSSFFLFPAAGKNKDKGLFTELCSMRVCFSECVHEVKSDRKEVFRSTTVTSQLLIFSTVEPRKWSENKFKAVLDNAWIR